jgi:hypothetical protein
MPVSGFSINDPQKPWTKDRGYKEWLKKIRGIKKTRRSSREDLCTGKSNICKGDIGIPRKLMPQFTVRNKPFSQRLITDFRRYLKRKYQIKSRKAKRTANDLKPSQNEISRARVEGLIEDDIIEKQEVPLVVSKNGYIVDGHHRWAAFRMKAPKHPMSVIEVDAPIQDILGISIEWGAEHSRF